MEYLRDYFWAAVGSMALSGCGTVALAASAPRMATANAERNRLYSPLYFCDFVCRAVCLDAIYLTEDRFSGIER